MTFDKKSALNEKVPVILFSKEKGLQRDEWVQKVRYICVLILL